VSKWVKSRHLGRGTNVRYYPESDRDSDLPDGRLQQPEKRSFDPRMPRAVYQFND
jgi:hypothetical protein